MTTPVLYDATDLGRHLRARRGALGMSARELGRRVGCTHVAILYIEAGTMAPSLRRLFAICHALGLSLALVPGAKAQGFVREDDDG